MTTINSWEVLTNDGWQHNFYGTTAHQFTYRTNDQQRKREESAETELGLHSNAITIMSFSISDVKNIFTGNSISFSQVHQSWATQISGLPSFFFFFVLNIFFFLWMNSLRRKVRDVANLVGCMSIFTSHLQFVLFIFFILFFPSSFWRFTSPLHQAGEAFQEQIKAFFSFHQKGSLWKQYKENMPVSSLFSSRKGKPSTLDWGTFKPSRFQT